MPATPDSRRRAFGAALGAALNMAGITQTEVARKLGTTQGSVSQWKAGISMPEPEMLFRLECVLGLPSGHLSHHLGYVPAGATTPMSVRDAVLSDPLLDGTAQRALIKLYEVFAPGA